MRARTGWFIVLVVIARAGLASPPAHAFLSLDESRCLTAITSGGHRFVSSSLALIRACRDADLKATGACPAPDPVELHDLEQRFDDDLGRRCPLSAAAFADMGFPGLCPDATPTDGFTVDELRACMTDTHRATVEAIVPLLYDPTVTGTLPFADLHCQKTVAKRGAVFAAVALRAVQKCRTAIARGTLRGIDPERCATDHAPTQKAIDRALRKVRHHVDGRCTDAQAERLHLCEPDESTAKGAAACVGSALLRLIGDADQCDLTDVEYADVPAVPCDVCPVPPPSEPQSCPTRVALTVDGAAADLDIGFTGLLHDRSLAGDAGLTLAVTGCTGASRPGCGVCELSGPAAGANGASDPQRCQDRSWISCTTDDDCTSAGAFGPCTHFLGAPQALIGGGVPGCVVTEIAGAVTGTLNVDDGSAATTLPLVATVHVGGTPEQPCPRCVADVCDAGSRLGEACTAAGTDGSGASLDCPPAPSAAAGTVGVQLHSSTGTQTVTVGMDNPPCRSAGANKRCLCDTCDNANADPCMTNADCPAHGGSPGICGGKRCLGGGNAGAPCATSSECPGGQGCGRPGEPTRPNACDYDDTITPSDGTLCVDTAPVGDGEGECPQVPTDSYCSIETFRYCSDDVDCTPGDACPSCVPGQTCLVGVPRRCFLNNGLVGGSDSVTGVASPPCGDVARPVVGAFFCVPPIGSAAVNAAAGLPGLGRLRVPLTAVLGQ